MSWILVYTVIALPGLLLCANFVFGRCDVDDELNRRRHIETPNVSAARRGKVTLVLVYASLLWQMYAYFWYFRTSWEGKSWSQCNFIATCFFFFDGISAHLVGNTNINPQQRGGSSFAEACDARDVGVQLLWALFVAQHVALVFSVPQSKRPSLHSSKCSKCMMHVDGMDHHCYFVHNCIGERNRAAFLRLLSLCFLLALFFVISTRLWVFALMHELWQAGTFFWSVDVMVVGGGWVAAAVCAVGSAKLLGYQLWLLYLGETRIQHMKRRRDAQRLHQK